MNSFGRLGNLILTMNLKDYEFEDRDLQCGIYCVDCIHYMYNF